MHGFVAACMVAGLRGCIDAWVGFKSAWECRCVGAWR